MNKARLKDRLLVGTCYHPRELVQTQQVLFSPISSDNQYKYYCGKCKYVWKTFNELQEWMNNYNK